MSVGPANRSWLARHPLLVTFMAGSALALGFMIAMLTRTHEQIASRLDAIRAAGLPVTVAEVATWYPLPPSDENAAPVIERSLDLYSRGGAETLPFVGTGELPPPSEPVPAALLEDMTDYLARNEAALSFLYAAAEMPHCRHAEVAAPEQMPSLTPHRTGVRLMKLDAFHRAETGDLQTAVRVLASSVKVGDLLHEEPFLVAQLARIACLSMSADGLEVTLNRHVLSDAQLADLQGLFAEAAERRPLWRAFAVERCWLIEIVGGALTGVGGNPLKRLVRQVNPLTWDVERSYARLLDGTDTLIAAAQGPPEEALAAVAHIIPEPEPGGGKGPMQKIGGDLSQLLLPALVKALEAQVRSIAQCRVVAAALAVERFRLAHGAYPERLEELASANLGVKLTDPYTNTPLLYSLDDTGFVVYSIGPNLRDDNGEHDPLQGDVAFAVRRAEVQERIQDGS